VSKVPNANLPSHGSAEYERILNVKLNEILRNVREVVNRHEDGYLFPSYTTDVDYIPTLNDSLILADATAGKVDITFKPPGEWKGKRYTIKKIDASANTVTGVGTIDGVTNWLTTTQNGYQSFASDGANIWKV
jgi:hypothetical protein